MNLEKRECACLKWQDTFLPCKHACAVIDEEAKEKKRMRGSDRDVKGYSHYIINPFYFTEKTWESTYANIIHPTPMPKTPDSISPILAPKEKKTPERKRVLRFKSYREGGRASKRAKKEERVRRGDDEEEEEGGGGDDCRSEEGGDEDEDEDDDDEEEEEDEEGGEDCGSDDDEEEEKEEEEMSPLRERLGMQPDDIGVDNAQQGGLLAPIPKIKRVYKCSFCKEKGHNAATCQVKKSTI